MTQLGILLNQQLDFKRSKYESMCEEIFGPVLTIYLYDSDKWDETLKLVNETSPYALTGCVWGNDRNAIMMQLKN